MTKTKSLGLSETLNQYIVAKGLQRVSGEESKE